MGRQLTVSQLIGELESLVEDPDNTLVYIANYQHYTPPEDMATEVEVLYVEEKEEERVYIEAHQTGEYVPGEVRDVFGWRDRY